MANDILDEFGGGSSQPQAGRASAGGEMEAKKIPYSPPVGPTTFSHEGPGLANHINHDNCGTQGKH